MAVAATLPARAAELAPESSFERIRRTGLLRISALPGEAPFFHKDLTTGEWSGASMRMARSIAETMGVRLDYVKGTYASSVLDLQTNKVDLAFALQPTPARALAIVLPARTTCTRSRSCRGPIFPPGPGRSWIGRR
jgi:polar amino acid transport system substrate-binding protein